MLDASGQALAYVYARETPEQADIAKVLTFDEARRIAVKAAGVAGSGSKSRRSLTIKARLPPFPRVPPNLVRL